MTTNQILTNNKMYLNPFVKLTGLYVVIGLITRFILLVNEQTLVNFSFAEWSQIFILGLANDVCIAIIGLFFVWLCLIFMSKSKYSSPWGYIIWGLIGLSLGYVCFFNTIFDEYGSVVPKIVIGFLTYKWVSFGLRLFIPRIRKTWSEVCYYLVFVLYVVNILFVAIGEYLFWDEFGVRYNFIAVDYLIYTNEVVGNIMESYPIVPLLSILFALSGIITFLLVRKDAKQFNFSHSFISKIAVSGIYLVLVCGAFFFLQFNSRFQTNRNVFSNELQANGAYKFCTAFVNSELSYNDFYATIPQQEATGILNNMYNSKGQNNDQQILDSIPEIHKNIVLITVESLSASFLKRYGNTEGLTPNLDSLMNESLVLDNLYATGNRTVRGLEAVTLCLPPSAGESIIKRPNNANLFSTGKVLKDKGYTVQYLYGGDSYFDNMETFFSGNGYDVIDKKDFFKDEITFSNVWGVCDEDMYRKAIRVFNKNAELDKPFFAHIMSVSNHRPYTYPDGKIDISSETKSRNGGVKYTDYAIGQFMAEAKKQTWFDNTIFVIVADHCASSAGKTEIPLDKYHIPALIYAPGFVEARQENKLVSQIDLMPTVFGLLHFSYNSQFYGKDLHSTDYQSRAFAATYQNLGYWTDNILTVLSPVRKVEQYYTEQRGGDKFDLEPTGNVDVLCIKAAIANYQGANKN